MRRLNFVGAATLLFCGCGNASAFNPFLGLTQVSRVSPFVTGCDQAPAGGTLGVNAEVEPILVSDPTDPQRLIGVWQQDRWAEGGARGLLTAVSADLGKTWTQSFPAFSRCTGGNAVNGGNYERATDPWVTVTPDGTIYQSSASFDALGGATNAFLVSHSTDHGHTWSDPVTIRRDTDPDVFNDKPAITADPFDASRVYAVWDRTTGLTNPDLSLTTGPTWFSRLTNGTWEAPTPIYDPGIGNQTIANQIVVLSDGSLVNFFLLIENSNSLDPIRHVAILRSTDHGTTWAPPIIASDFQSVVAGNVDNLETIRSGEDVPAVAVDRSSGRIYAVWEDARFSQGQRNGVVISSSSDQGFTWSSPVQINKDPTAAAFGPSLAVSAGGRIAVGYYDLRNDDPNNAALFLANAWLITSDDRGHTWQESAVTGAFDMGQATFGLQYFLGDYQGLASVGEAFVPFFSAANADPSNPTDILVRPL